ncbi:MAG: glycosyltransferase [Phycisphaera sp.]|nr:glycosyltransferase [Phycisphaera sp.]
MPRDTQLAILIVNYKTPGDTVDCLRSLEPEVKTLNGCRVIVTDNASGDDSVQRIAHTISTRGWDAWCTFRGLDHNTGYAGGNNAALEIALAQCDPQYIMLLNPDTVVRPGALRTMVEFMENHPAAGMVGSRLEFPDGTPQNSAFRFPTALSELETSLRLGVVSRVLRRHVSSIPATDRDHTCDWVAGASMVIRREVIDNLGLFDAEYFMYFEEVDFCLRARRAGYECWYTPSARVVHLVGQSSGVTDTKRKPKRRPAYWFESRRRFFTKNYGFVRATLADAAFAVGFALWRVRRALQRKQDNDPPHMLWDFLRHSTIFRGA